jgi:hypothetical protein
VLLKGENKMTQKIVVIFEDKKQRQGYADAYFDIDDNDSFKTLLTLSAKEVWKNPKDKKTLKHCPYPVFGDYNETELYVIDDANLIEQIKQKFNPEIVIY